MIGMLAKKMGMTQVFDKEGKQIPVTVLEAGPCYVTGLRTREKHGYNAVQLGFGPVRKKCLNKAKLGHLKKTQCPLLRYIKEIRTDEIDGLKLGTTLTVENFEVGDFVDVEGVSIGRGFQGGIKRHHFKGAATMSHGDMHRRRVGSIGASSFPSRVMKGMRMAGHMGDARATVQNLEVIQIDAEHNLVALCGSVPGVEGDCVVIRQALKKYTKRKWKIEGLSEESPKEAAPQDEVKQEDPSETAKKK
jgi:large subunit ribosomal protein L3